MIALAIVFYNIYPRNEFNNSMIATLICWASAFGPIYWIGGRVGDMIDSENSLRPWNQIIAATQALIIFAGLALLLIACFQLQQI
ncbi:MAG: hypothetical protein A2Z28_04665 [Chloroflexi bacterium RBG_16_51_9]|nr:MAG: hypothetical protein A2Z28_04665 [Chloroflexi bacterium RBG_16_51_9]